MTAETLTITPGYAIQGTVQPPGDKSISHRAALFAALAGSPAQPGESCFENFLVAGVTRAMLDALQVLGVEWRLEGTTLTVRGAGPEGLRQSARRRHGDAPARLDCGHSGTTLRLLAGALAAAGTPAILDGSPGLRRRPMKRIVAPLQQMGMPIQSAEGYAPLHLGRPAFPLHALDNTLPVARAQVKSCLLLAALSGDGPTTLMEPGSSRDHTERMLRAMGVSVEGPIQEGHQYRTRLEPPQPFNLAPLEMTLPGDFSAAAFLIVAALITPGSDLILQGVNLNPTRTGLLDALLRMGANIQVTPHGEAGGEPTGDLRVRYSQLHAAEISGNLVVRMIDEFPAFGVAAAFALGETRVRQAGELRLKESDRIAALAGELRKLGARIVEVEDGFDVTGGSPLLGAEVHSHGDHRLAMALAVAGLATQQPVVVHGADLIAESFPAFPAVLRRLGAQVTAFE